MTEKLPVFATLVEAIRCVRRYGGRVWPHVVGLGIVVLVISLLLGGENALLGQGQRNPPDPREGLIVLPTALAFILAMLPITNSLQRLIVQGSQARVGLSYEREEWLTVRTGVKMWFIVLGIMLAVFIPCMILLYILMPSHPDIYAVIVLPLFVIFMTLMMRWSLVFPAAANGRSMTLRESFCLTRGNGWRIFGVIFLGNIVFSLLQNGAQFFVSVSPMLAGGASGIFMMLGMFFNSIITALIYVRLEEIASRGEPETVE